MNNSNNQNQQENFYRIDYKPMVTKTPSEEDVFKIFKANSNEVWETDFLISCFPVL